MSSEGSHSQPNDPTPASAVVPSDHILDCWLESVSYLPSFLDDTNDINTYPWWIPPDDDFSHESLPPPSTTVNLNHLHHGTTSATMAAATPQSLPPPSVNNTFHLIQPETKFDQPPQVSNNLPRKRKLGQEKKTQSCDDHHQDSSSGGGGGDASAVIESGGGTAPAVAGGGGGVRRANGGKKGGKQSQGNSGNGGSNKEGRWAEQLLNPCAACQRQTLPRRRGSDGLDNFRGDGVEILPEITAEFHADKHAGKSRKDESQIETNPFTIEKICR